MDKKKMKAALAAPALAALAAAGAASPLASTNDYVFTRVTRPELIRGVVMGDGGDYRAMRYEDLAFLIEAWREREALAAGGLGYDFTTNDPASSTRWEFGRWAADDTNGTWRSVQAVTAPGLTQTVARAFAETTLLPRGVALDPAGRTRISARALLPSNVGRYACGTNAYITEPYVTASSADQGLAWKLDLCCKGGGPFLYEDTAAVLLSGPFLASAVTNAYATVRRMDRPVVRLGSTNRLMRVDSEEVEYGYSMERTPSADDWNGHYAWKGRPYQDHQVYTADPAGLGGYIYYFDVSASSSAARKRGRYREWDDERFPEHTLPAVVDWGKYLHVTAPTEAGSVFQAPFKLCVATHGRPKGSPRVAGGDFFLGAKVEGKVIRRERDVETVERELKTFVVVPVAATLDEEGEAAGYANFTISPGIDEALAAAAEAAGFKIPRSFDDERFSVEAPALGADEWYAEAAWIFDLKVFPYGLVAVLRIDPTTKLEGW